MTTKNKNKKKEPINPMDIFQIILFLFGLSGIVIVAIMIMYYETHPF